MWRSAVWVIQLARPSSHAQNNLSKLSTFYQGDCFFSMTSWGLQVTRELDGPLACISDRMTLLNSFPYIKNCLWNSTLAYCTCLCCMLSTAFAMLDFSPQNSINFEKQFLVKLNSKFREWCCKKVLLTYCPAICCAASCICNISLLRFIGSLFCWLWIEPEGKLNV